MFLSEKIYIRHKSSFADMFRAFTKRKKVMLKSFGVSRDNDSYDVSIFKDGLFFWRGGESDVKLGFCFYLRDLGLLQKQVKTFFKKQVIPSRIWVLEQDHGFLSVHTEGEVC